MTTRTLQTVVLAAILTFGASSTTLAGRPAHPAETSMVLEARGTDGHEVVALRDRDGREVRLRLALARPGPPTPTQRAALR